MCSDISTSFVISEIDVGMDISVVCSNDCVIYIINLLFFPLRGKVSRYF